MSLNLKNIHILVVEDIEPMRELMSGLLKTMGFGKVSLARDGEHGFREFQRYNHDMIITDWHMLPESGLDLTKKIRMSTSSPNRAVPIIMMTGFSARERLGLSRDSGVNEFLVKPFSAGDLSKRINHIVRKPRDFIIAENFVGPDRRRLKKDEFDGEQKRSADKGLKQRIKADLNLQIKAGLGAIDENAVKRSQSILDNNRIDFKPLAHKFLADLMDGLEKLSKAEQISSRSISLLSDPVMQLKANGHIFGYTLIGNLAKTMLGFLENLNVLDQDAIKIVDAHHKTLSLIINREMNGDGGEIGASFQNELENACNRYMKVKALVMKEKFKGHIEKEET